jgi:N-acetylated-alpha-linked acidic dipeptidase
MLGSIRHISCCALVFAAAVFVNIPALSEPDAAGPAPDAANPNRLLGYSNQSSILEQQRELKFRAAVSPDNIRETMRRLTARPHHVGSPYDKDNAEWILTRFKEWGFDAKIETFQVLFPTPKNRVVELLKPTPFRARLQEPPVPGDPTSDQVSEQLPTYNAYSADGDVTAPLIYVNYGNREDYEQLDRLGISVKGAIVIARYGGGWRGVKPKVAAEHGAVGCIIYSDPKGDGYYEGDQYPAGGWRPKEGVQRGSVMDTEYPGDPLTPGVGATAKAKRLALKDAKTITTIPVLPISYADALPLLSALQGPVAPASWRGALSITYHIGPGPALVHLAVSSNWDLKPIYDVITTPGSMEQTIRSPDKLRCSRRRVSWERCTSRAGTRPAPSFTAHGTVRSRGFWVRWSGSRRIWTSSSGMRSPTSTPIPTNAATCCPGARRIWRASSAESRAPSRIPRRT